MKAVLQSDKIKSLSVIKKCIGWITGASLLCVTQQAQGHDNSFVQASYAFTLNMAQSIEELEASYSIGYDIRWVSFRSRIFAITGEYNSANSALYKRTAYQQTRVGFQYYPLALGVNFQDSYESVATTYESFVKPYIGANVGFGRFLVKPLSSEATDGFEQSVDHVIVGGALGTHLQFSSRFAADLAADTGFVMSNSTIALSGLLLRVRAGLMMAM